MKIEFNKDAFYQLRSEPGVVGLLEEKAQRLADTANASGSGTYAVGSRQGARRPQGRWRASVVTADYAAMRDQAKNHTLQRALGSL